jgi:hypothetical protein
MRISSRPATVALAAAAPLLVLLAACGSSAPTAKATTTAASTTTVAKASTTAAPATATTVAFTGKGSEAFCAVVKELDAFDPGSTTDKASIEKGIKENLALLTKATGVAPDEIKPEMQITLEATTKLAAIFERNGYDVTKIGADPEAAVTLQGDEKTRAASERLDAYGTQVCGVTSR